MGVNAELVKLMGPQLELLLPVLDERSRRLALAAVARAAGDGGVTAVARAAGASWQTVADGVAELESGQVAPEGRIRRPGAGRKKLAETDPGLLPALLALVEDSTRGDPESPLTWTTKSVKKLSDELAGQGHRCSPQTAWRLLREQGFSTQANAKVTEGRRHPDRDAQFRYIAAQASGHLAAGQPVISVDAKKKEQVGQYAQAGREWRPEGDPVKVRDHSFADEQAGHAIPYGVYDVAANTGFVNVGTDHNTAAFAVESIRRWWDLIGRGAYPHAGRLLVTCDAGGSNGWRNRAWKAGLAQFADDSGLEITCCHFPPGTSKWNKIEHRLFSAITLNWRGRPLTSHDVIINTIGAVRTATGLSVTAVLDENSYPTGIQVSDAQMADLEDRALTRHRFHGDWNYALSPAPAAPPGAPAPSRPAGPDPATLRDLAAIAGLTTQDLDDLAAALTIPWHAQLESWLYQARGGPRRHASGAGGNRKPGLPGHILVTILHDRHGASRHALGALTGLDPNTIRLAISRTRDLLTRHRPHALTPDSSARPALRDYAARAGLTIRRPATGTNPHAENTKTPDTPPTHSILECLPGVPDLPRRPDPPC
jgi:Rhodopirellula transposase DDE domain